MSAFAFMFSSLIVVLYEEMGLRHMFGEAYDQYCNKVPRWILLVEGNLALTSNCELTASVSFALEQESMKDSLLEYYKRVSEELLAAGFGECGPPLILLPQSADIGGVQTIIPGRFAFDCSLSFSEVKSALSELRASFKDMVPVPDLSVTLHDRDSRGRIRLYPRNDIESYLSDLL